MQLRLPSIAHIINATVHERTGVTPAQLLFGNTINLDHGIILPLATEAVEKIESITISISVWLDMMLSDQLKLPSLAYHRQTRSMTNIKNTIQEM